MEYAPRSRVNTHKVDEKCCKLGTEKELSYLISKKKCLTQYIGLKKSVCFLYLLKILRCLNCRLKQRVLTLQDINLKVILQIIDQKHQPIPQMPHRWFNLMYTAKTQTC